MKIGILTHYYDSKNYGGLLQAYALVTFLKSEGVEAEQICFDFKHSKKNFCDTRQVKLPAEKKKSRKREFHIIQSILCRTRNLKNIIINYIEKKQIDFYEKKYISARYSNFRSFEDHIAHSQTVYNNENIHECQSYDCYLVGSDQVWNLNWYSPVFFLEFVPKTKKKISYAASVGKADFNDEEAAYLQRVLPEFDAVSVREHDLVEKLSFIIDRNIIQVVDPVFLLSKEDWDAVASERLVSERYVFCYFLSSNEYKAFIKKYARKHGLKIVAIPFSNEYARDVEDLWFPDIRINCAGPKEFVSLIKNADVIFTDSFHSTAFSLIFGKEFFVFGRSDDNKMNSRIDSICNMFHCTDRFCNTEETQSINYIDSIRSAYDYTCLESMRKASIRFLKDSLDLKEIS